MATYEQALQNEMTQANVTVLRKGAYQVASSSQPDQFHIVVYVGRGDEAEVALWNCTCPARRTCRHIKLVSGIVDRVNDEFGYE